MSRRVKIHTIPGVYADAIGERDNGKSFILTEMDAYRGQDWALRALLALAASGVHIPPEALKSGWGALAGYAFDALLGARYADVSPLLEEMLQQAVYSAQPNNPKFPTIAIKAGPDCQVEEIKTFLILHRELFELHTGFTVPALIQTMGLKPSTEVVLAG